MSNPETKLTGEHLCDCKCGRAVFVSRLPVTGVVSSVMHAVPMCEDFEKREAHDYIHWLYTLKAPS